MSWLSLEAQRAYMKTWRKKNREKTRSYMALYREAHRQELRDKHQAWRAANPEKNKAIKKRYVATHPAQVRRVDRRFKRREKERNLKLIESLPCLDCGMRHTPERRATILRRMLPARPEEIRDAWTCIWGLPFEHDTAGEQRLYRDLFLLGARAVAGIYALKEAA